MLTIEDLSEQEKLEILSKAVDQMNIAKNKDIEKFLEIERQKQVSKEFAKDLKWVQDQPNKSNIRIRILSLVNFVWKISHNDRSKSKLKLHTEEELASYIEFISDVCQLLHKWHNKIHEEKWLQWKHTYLLCLNPSVIYGIT